MVSTIEVSYRNIARLLCQTDREANDYAEALEFTLTQVKALPAQTKLSMRIAYIFASKVPHEEREDCFQTFTATLLKSGISDERLAYAVIRADWLDFWRAYKVKERARTTLESEVTDADGNAAELGDLLIGEVEFENKMESTLDTASLWSQIPADMRSLIAKRLSGQNLTTSRGTREPVSEPLIGRNRKEYKRFVRRGRPTTGAALSNTERSRFNRWVKSDAARLLLQDYAPRNTN